MSNLSLLWFYLIGVNGVSFLLMGLDKLGAKVGSERVPERLFFMLALGGGFFGILLGMLTFHHKVSKTSFQLKALVATILGALILFFLFTIT